MLHVDADLVPGRDSNQRNMGRPGLGELQQRTVGERRTTVHSAVEAQLARMTAKVASQQRSTHAACDKEPAAAKRGRAPLGFGEFLVGKHSLKLTELAC